MTRPFVAVACAALAAVCAVPAVAADDDGAAGSVRELAYGEVLYHYFQDDYLTALTRLLAAGARNELSEHRADGELLLGALYLSYGQHRRAGEVFERVLAESVERDVHDRAWFFLARIWYQRGYFAEADAALGRISDGLPAPLEQERVMLHAQILMALERFDDALAVLEAHEARGGDRAAFARYNIGVALVRLGRVADGARVLDDVGRIATDDPEIAALRDRANVALGYAWLQSGRADAAKVPLERVRLSGPFSNKALLGVGWAEVEQQRHAAALTPWLELRGRSLRDSAVQESLLAVPYAYASLGADRQAADHYIDAIGRYEAEAARIGQTIADIRDGSLLVDLLESSAAGAGGWYWRLDAIPAGDESLYLYELIATHDFQESLKSYRDLLALENNLDDWAGSLDAFDDILDTKQRAWRERMPRVETSLARVDLDAMNARRIELTSRHGEIARGSDYVALGTPAEQRLWADFQSIEARLAWLGDDDRAAALRDRHRLLRGLLRWELEREFKGRLWAQQRELRELERLLSEARRRDQRVTAARDGWPDQFAALTGRIGRLAPRVEALRARTSTARARQRAHVERMAIDELEARRERIETYRVQARFALASLYDRAAAAAPPAGARSGENP